MSLESRKPITLSEVAQWCEEIYSEPDESDPEFEARMITSMMATGLTDVSVFQASEVQVAVGTRAEVQVVIFRGTDSVSKILNNFFIGSDPDPIIPGVSVHSVWGNDVGLFMAWAEKKIDWTGSKLKYFCGHSRGGAQAQIAAARYRQRGHDTVCISFESPRAGNSRFAQYVNRSLPHIRVARSGDIVPLTPFPPLYHHTCRPWFLDRHGLLRYDSRFGSRMYSHFLSLLSHIGRRGIAAFEYHSMEQVADLIHRNESSVGESLIERML